MAHFSNGTEALAYREEWCFKCQHGQSDESCMVWRAHYDYSYELCNKCESPGKQILDMLIPVDKDHWPQKCSMFVKNICEGKRTAIELKERASELMRDGRMSEAIKVYNQAWDMERTQGDG